MWVRDSRDLRRIGAWTWELRGDEVADLRFDGAPVLRSVRAVVRDRDWNTADMVVEGVEPTPTGLTVGVRADGGDSVVTGVVRVEAHGSRFAVHCDLVSESAFDTNRTGLVVLHPPSLAGVALDIEHADGTHEQSAFPRAISPHQPAFEIAGLGWDYRGGRVELRFDGDVFEMEDQRNWTDASFKTYSRPLALPFPYRLDAGEHVVQSVTVEAHGVEPSAPRHDRDALQLGEAGPFPEIAVAASTAPDPAPRRAGTGAACVLVELDLEWDGWPVALRRAASAGLPLDVRLLLPEVDPAESARSAVAAVASFPIVRIGAFWQRGDSAHVSDQRAVDLLTRAITEVGIAAPIVGGARSHFTQLNRERRRVPDSVEGIVFSVTPLFHSLDTEQLVESLAIQRLVAEQAVALAGGRPVHVGPVTLRPRFNDVATTPPPRPASSDLSVGYGPERMDADDPRQDAPELAAWTIAAAAALSVSGVASIAFFEEWGARGVLTSSGTPRPVAAAVRALAALSGSPARSGASDDGKVWAIARSSGDGTTLLVANLDVVERTVAILGGAEATVTVGPGAWVRWASASPPNLGVTDV